MATPARRLRIEEVLSEVRRVECHVEFHRNRKIGKSWQTDEEAGEDKPCPVDIIEREDDSYVALCPELDIASQGDTVESARKNTLPEGAS